MTRPDMHNLEVGKRYVVQMTCVMRELVAECIDNNDKRYGGRPKLKVLNNGPLKDIVMRGDDIVAVLEEYNEAKHGPIE